MTALISPLDNGLYAIPTGVLFFRPNGSDAFINLGDVDDCTLNIDVQVADRYTNNTPVRSLVISVVTTATAELALTLTQLTGFNKALSLMASADKDTQAAVTAGTFSVTDAVVGGVYKIPAVQLTSATVTGTGTGAVVEGVDYVIDTVAGIIQSLTMTGALTVTYAAPANTTDKHGVANAPSIRGTFMLRQVNAVGPQSLLWLHDVELRPSSARGFITGDKYSDVQLKGRCYVDPTQPTEFALGYETCLSLTT